MVNDEIKRTWEKNASEWIRVIEGGIIESREFTNAAIIESVLSHSPANALDLGCGEGWLTRELSKSGIVCTGIDASSPLIKNARKKGNQNYLNLSYEETIQDPNIKGNPFDAIIFNFSLFLNEETELLLKSLKTVISKNGRIFIQTLHPAFLVKNSLPYRSQWIEDSWAGLKGDFKDPHQWYIRTFTDWLKTFNYCGLNLESIKEPVNNENQPLSVIFELSKASS